MQRINSFKPTEDTRESLQEAIAYEKQLVASYLEWSRKEYVDTLINVQQGIINKAASEIGRLNKKFAEAPSKMEASLLRLKQLEARLKKLEARPMMEKLDKKLEALKSLMNSDNADVRRMATDLFAKIKGDITER